MFPWHGPRETSPPKFTNAARNAYLAALNAARAVIFDRTSMAPKAHSGTRSKFHDLIREGLLFETRLAKFLSDGFDQAGRGLWPASHLRFA